MMHASLPQELPQQEPDEPQPLGTLRDAEQRALPSQHAPRDQREQKWLRTEHSDQDMSDQEHSTLKPPESSPAITPRSESITTDPVTAPTAHVELLAHYTPHITSNTGSNTPNLEPGVLRSTDEPVIQDDTDTNSQYTRISIGSALLERGSEAESTIDSPHQGGGCQGRTQIDDLLPQSWESEADSSSRIGSGSQQQVLETFLDQLMRAEGRAGESGRELESQRLQEEFGFSKQEGSVPEVSPGYQERRDSSPRPSDGRSEDVIHSSDPDLTKAVGPEPAQVRTTRTSP
ncbi:conserved hypothetical protein [Aspergillus udagawae]|nr:conserved hypothetical protein [Aspergillus udagawae]